MEIQDFPSMEEASRVFPHLLMQVESPTKAQTHAMLNKGQTLLRSDYIRAK
jgi:reverse gyrase